MDGNHKPLTGYALTDKLWEDGVLQLWRGYDSEQTEALFRLAAYDHSDALNRLEFEYGLRDCLAPAWATMPLALHTVNSAPCLVLTDPGGQLLADHVGAPLEIIRFLDIAIGLADAISALHGQGLIHKDIKPANVLINFETAKTHLTGFGFAAKDLFEQRTNGALDRIPGTFAYMAPEQTGRMNRSVDMRSDLYSLGVVCYELLTGRLPFSATDSMGWIHCHIARQPPPPCGLKTRHARTNLADRAEAVVQGGGRPLPKRRRGGGGPATLPR